MAANAHLVQVKLTQIKPGNVRGIRMSDQHPVKLVIHPASLGDASGPAKVGDVVPMHPTRIIETAR